MAKKGSRSKSKASAAEKAARREAYAAKKKAEQSEKSQLEAGNASSSPSEHEDGGQSSSSKQPTDERETQADSTSAQASDTDSNDGSTRMPSTTAGKSSASHKSSSRTERGRQNVLKSSPMTDDYEEGRLDPTSAPTRNVSSTSDATSRRSPRTSRSPSHDAGTRRQQRALTLSYAQHKRDSTSATGDSERAKSDSTSAPYASDDSTRESSTTADNPRAERKARRARIRALKAASHETDSERDYTSATDGSEARAPQSEDAQSLDPTGSSSTTKRSITKIKIPIRSSRAGGRLRAQPDIHLTGRESITPLGDTSPSESGSEDDARRAIDSTENKSPTDLTRSERAARREAKKTTTWTENNPGATLPDNDMQDKGDNLEGGEIVSQHTDHSNQESLKEKSTSKTGLSSTTAQGPKLHDTEHQQSDSHHDERLSATSRLSTTSEHGGEPSGSSSSSTMSSSRDGSSSDMSLDGSGDFDEGLYDGMSDEQIERLLSSRKAAAKASSDKRAKRQLPKPLSQSRSRELVPPASSGGRNKKSKSSRKVKFRDIDASVHDDEIEDLRKENDKLQKELRNLRKSQEGFKTREQDQRRTQKELRTELDNLTSKVETMGITTRKKVNSDEHTAATQSANAWNSATNVGGSSSDVLKMHSGRIAILKKVGITEGDWSKLQKSWEDPDDAVDDREDVAFRNTEHNKQVLQSILIDVDYTLVDKNSIPDPKKLFDDFKGLSTSQLRSLCTSDMTADALFRALVDQWPHNAQGFVRAILRGDASVCQLLLHLHDEQDDYDSSMYDYYTCTRAMRRCLEYDCPEEELRTMTMEERYSALTSQSRDYVEEYREALKYIARKIIEYTEQTIRKLKDMGHPTIMHELQHTKKVQRVIEAMYETTSTQLLDQDGSLMFSGNFELVPPAIAKFQLLFLHMLVVQHDTSYSRQQVLEEELMAKLSVDMVNMPITDFINFVDMIANALEVCTKSKALEVLHKCLAHWTNNTLAAITEQGPATSPLTQMLTTVCVDQMTNTLRRPKEVYQHLQNLAEMHRKNLRSQAERNTRSPVIQGGRTKTQFVASAGSRSTTPQRQSSNFAGKQSTGGTSRKSDTQWKSDKPERTRSKPAAKSKFPTRDTKARPTGWQDLSQPGHVYANSSELVIRKNTYFDKPCRAPRTCEMVGLEKATGSAWARQRCKFQHENVTYKGTLEQLKRHNRNEYAKNGMPVSKTREQIEERERRIIDRTPALKNAHTSNAVALDEEFISPTGDGLPHTRL